MKLLKVDSLKETEDKLMRYFGDTGSGPEAETVSIREAVGRYLAEDIVSGADMPAFTKSVVDGFAVFARDTFGTEQSSPVFLDLIEPVEMGKAYSGELKPGQAAYIPTGAMLPKGADSVVMVEYTEFLDERTIAVYKSAAPNANLMNKGDDLKEGQSLFLKGHRIAAKDAGLLAAVGKSAVKVFQKPGISIISTGDELVDIAETPKYGEVRDVNSYAIAALAERDGAEIRTMVRVSDVEATIRKRLEEALEENDIVLLSGGSSAGVKDMTADIIDVMGEPGVITHGIAMKPGKPTIIGVVERPFGDRLCRKLIVGLPGHPVAAVIAYHAIVREFIMKYCFHTESKPLSLTARVTENIHTGEGRETFQLVSLTQGENPQLGDLQSGALRSGGFQTGETKEWIARPIHAKSGAVSQLLTADGYIRISSLTEGVKAGTMAEVILIG